MLIPTSEKNCFKGFFDNKFFVAIIIGTSGIQAIFVEFGSDFTQTEHLNWWKWLMCIGIGALELPVGFLLRFIPVDSIYFPSFSPFSYKRVNSIYCWFCLFVCLVWFCFVLFCYVLFYCLLLPLYYFYLFIIIITIIFLWHSKTLKHNQQWNHSLRERWEMLAHQWPNPSLTNKPLLWNPTLPLLARQTETQE